jgi:CheY-like chemotaxis protein
LSLQGYRLIVAKDGREAVQLAQTYRPQLIVIDLQMPNVNGIMAIEELRADPAFADVPVLALTAMVLSNYRDRALAAGANEYLTKPIRMKDLLKAIQDLLV